MANSGIKIQILHDNNASFSGIILSSGEPAYSLDTKVFKVGDGISSWNTLLPIGGGGGGVEINDLTSSVVWANVPNANITQSSVLQHSGAFRIKENQIVDFKNYLLNVSGDVSPTLGGNLNINSRNINGSGNINVSGSLVVSSGLFNNVSFNTSLPDPSLLQGQLAWNPSEGTVSIGFTNTYAQNLGEELHYRIRNNTTNTILKGTPVFASGLTPGGNNRIEVAPFIANGSIREIRFMGLATENIVNSTEGYTTHFGYIRGLDTRGNASTNGTTDKLWASGEPVWVEGDILYAHPSVSGKLTKIPPRHNISVAIILNVHQNAGKLFVRPLSFGHLEDNHDVLMSGISHNDVLVYNSGTALWENNNSVVVSQTQGIAGSSGIDNIVVMTSGAYNSLGSYNSNVIYFIV
jgi:hypothetical protein